MQSASIDHSQTHPTIYVLEGSQQVHRLHTDQLSPPCPPPISSVSSWVPQEADPKRLMCRTFTWESPKFQHLSKEGKGSKIRQKLSHDADHDSLNQCHGAALRQDAPSELS